MHACLAMSHLYMHVFCGAQGLMQALYLGLTGFISLMSCRFSALACLFTFCCTQMFRRKKWKYLILDEAHMIKNWKSQRWQTLLRFNSKRRLLITGTPLQVGGQAGRGGKYSAHVAISVLHRVQPSDGERGWITAGGPTSSSTESLTQRPSASYPQ